MDTTESERGTTSIEIELEERKSNDVVAVNDMKWHNMSVEQVCQRVELQDIAAGLTTEVANQRLHKYGRNTISGKKSIIPKWIKLLWSHTFTMMNIVLTFATVLCGVVQDWVDFGVLIFIILTNIVVGFLQEFRSEKTMQRLQKLTASNTKVLRDGHVQEVESSSIVVGDVVVLKEGDSVPADLRIFESVQLECNEALLTGESVPVKKDVDQMDDKAKSPTDTDNKTQIEQNEAEEEKKKKKKNKKTVPLGDRKNCAFMSTTVAKGKGKGVVVETGMNTEIGKIASSLGKSRDKKTPLQKRMTILGIILVIVAIIAIAVVIICVWQYEGKNNIFPNALTVGISIAVAIIPECMIVVITLTMTVGLRQMAKEHVIVRKMAALENLGNVHSICTDKTGTLTEGKMVVTNTWVDDREYSISSTPANPIVGKMTLSDGDITELSDSLNKLITVASLCNTSSLVVKSANNETSITVNESEANPSPRKEQGSEDNEIEIVATGDPTEIALNAFSQKMNMSRANLEQSGFEKLGEYPFDSSIKRMTVVYSKSVNDTKELIVLTKGAPDRVIDLCSHGISNGVEVEMDSEFIKKIEEQNDSMASRGLRVLALAYRATTEYNQEAKREDVESDLSFIGLVGIQDPPREEVPKAVATCSGAGILVHMVTGDHKATARAIAQKVGILKDEDLNKPNIVMEASEFDLLTDEELKNMKELPLVIARCSPQSKVKMVKALHDRKKIVAMTGDGVNDAPAISDSDIGIAMGKAGSDVTKEAGDMILTDDNFASIVSAIRQGRRIFRNIRKFVIHLLSANVAQLLSLLIPVMAGYKIPLNATQILWVNMVTSSPCAMALGIEKPPKDIMKKKRYKIGQSLFNFETLCDVFFFGAVMGGVIMLNYFLMTVAWLNRSLESARAVTFTTMVFILLYHTYNCRNTRKPFFADQVWKSWFVHLTLLFVVALQCMILYIPKINSVLFKHNPLKGEEWGFVLVGTVVFAVISEIYKFIKVIIALTYTTTKHKIKDARKRSREASAPSSSPTEVALDNKLSEC